MKWHIKLQYFFFTLIQEKARQEFEGTVEDYIQAGERLFGPYVWGRYDVLVMPPSFPFGGMENPCLTVITPCVLVGDGSMSDVVMHEIVRGIIINIKIKFQLFNLQVQSFPQSNPNLYVIFVRVKRIRMKRKRGGSRYNHYSAFELQAPFPTIGAVNASHSRCSRDMESFRFWIILLLVIMSSFFVLCCTETII